MGVDLAHGRGAVAFHGLQVEAEDLGRFLVAVALGDELDHAALPRRQGAVGERALRQIGIQQGLGDASGEEWLVLGQRLYGRDQELAGIRLEQVAARSGLKQFAQQRLALVRGKEQDLGLSGASISA
jgi:hypothetical protein